MRIKHCVSLLVLFAFAMQLKAQISITAPVTVFSENFNTIGTSATATLPSGWRVGATTGYASGTNATTVAGGTSGTGVITASATGGTYNFANGVTASSTDRSVGFISSGSFSSPRSLFTQLINNTGNQITVLNITYDIEKYRSGTRAFDIAFFYSPDGTTWTAASAGNQSYSLDATNNVVNPPTTISKSLAITGIAIANGASYYLMWTYTGSGGATNAQGLGIDNFTVSAINCNTITTQASGLTTGAATPTQLGISWTTGGGTGGTTVLARSASAVNANPVSGIVYSASAVFGSGSQIGTGNYVVSYGVPNSATVTALTPETNYQFAAYTFDSGTPCYQATSPATASGYTLSNTALSDAGSFASSLPSCSDLALSWTAAGFPGTGATASGYIVLMRSDGTNPTTAGITNATLPGSLVLPAGTTLVANVTGTSTPVSGLSSGITYNFLLIPYTWNGSITGTYNYYLSGSSPTTTGTTSNTATSTFYYRSRISGNWDVATNWEASPTGSGGWVTACTSPTNAAAAVTILSGHTITVNTAATAPNLTIDGTLTFDNTARTLAVTDYINISATGTFITQASGTATHTLSIGGNITNNGIFDMSRGGTTLICNVTFNKNGNQSVSGTGATTRFNYISLNMGSSYSNVLDISSSSFAAATAFLHPAAAASPNGLINGTLKLSGTYTFTGTLFKSGAFYNIVSTAGVWINNPNVTITGTNDSYDVSGTLKVSAGTFTAGSTASNAIRLLNGSSMYVSGGTVNAAGRIQAYESTGTTAQVTTFNMSGGTVVLSKAGVNTSSMPEFTLDLTTDSLIISGGTMIFHNQATAADDLLNRATSVISGGLVQMGDATTASATAAGFYIESYGILPSLTIYPCNTVTNVVLATHLKVEGNITIGTGTKLNNRWGTIIQTYNISLTGNWINNGTFIHNSVKGVTFYGTGAQNITGSASTTFNILTINNAAGVTLQKPATVLSLLNLNSGLLYSSSTNLLSMGTASSVGAVSNNSFVYGPVAKTGTTDFTFPVGKDLKYRPITVSTLTGSETFTAEYFHADPDNVPYDVSLKDPTLNNIGRCEYWILNRPGSVNANVILSWDSYSCGITSLTDLAVARWDGSMWKDEGNTATTGSPDPGTGTVMSAVVSSFSPFTISNRMNTSTVNPLPVELLAFKAAYNPENTVDVKWVTATEVNNDYFTVERSADAVLFDDVSVVDGAGNSSSVLKYQTVDRLPLDETSYYRLKQTDFDGHYKYSDVIAVEKKAAEFDIVNVRYPESQNGLDVSFNCSGDCRIFLELYDLAGQKIYSSQYTLSGTHPEIEIPRKDLSHGIYLLRAQCGEKLVSRKVNL